MEFDTIGKRIKFARIILGLNQSEVVTRLGVRQQAISVWEADICKPSATIVPKLAEVLNCTPAWLYFGVGSRPE